MAERTDAVAPELPEGTVTLLFTDVEAPTDLRTTCGDEAANARLQTHGGLIRRQLDEHGVHEAKAMGDGLMVRGLKVLPFSSRALSRSIPT